MTGMRVAVIEIVVVALLAVRPAGAGAHARLSRPLAVAAQSPPAAPAGDAVVGKALFQADGSCVSCHSIENRERRSGPDLSWIGMLRTPDSLRRSLIDPGKHPLTPSFALKFPAAEIDHLVAFLRTLRSIPPSEPRERTRSIAPVSENAAFFDRPERDAEERTEALVTALEIREGAAVADIGAGTGYFTWRLAQRAGPTGKVIAVDIQQSMLDLAAQTVTEHGLANVDYVLGKAGDPRLPAGSLDMVFIAHSYHEFTQPETIMEALRRSLKPGGRLVVVEYAKESKLAPASTLHKMSFDEIRNEIEPMGFDLDRILDFLPVQHGLIFTAR
jgi:precorrin-6B methylase 2/mono/diheme cytochrome c family protein